MAETRIEWTASASGAPGYTFNPWRGCTKVSPGCTNCYAETLSKRNPSVLGEWGPKGTRALASESYWRQPLKWDREAAAAGERRRVFCASLADVFEDRPELVAPRFWLLSLIADTPHLDWLLLTKRPENIRELWPLNYAPIPNVWLGVSVEDQQRADERIPVLLDTPAAVRFLSCEPLLGPLDLTPWLARLDWCIVGGESGKGARPCDIRWIRGILAQCECTRCAPFIKQVGAKPFDGAAVHIPVDVLFINDPKGGAIEEWPDDLRVRRFPR